MSKTATLLVLLMFLFVMLAGCGGQAIRENPEKLGFIMVSRGKASGVAGLFGGGTDYCKATQYNLSGVAFVGEIVYDGDSCRVEVSASDE